jgi:hypothetical protein
MSDYTPNLKKMLWEAGCYFDRPGKGSKEQEAGGRMKVKG